MNRKARAFLLSPVAIALMAAFPVLAQNAPANDTAKAAGDSADSTTKVENVTITATKRNERITDVPAAITAIGATEMRERGAVDIRDMQYSIPGLNIQQLVPGASRISLRGINSGFGTGLAVVGTYVDEMGVTPDGAQFDTPFPVADMARIEVLRGPQGTLYGEGAMAGTIRYITRNPSLTSSDGFVEANVYQMDGGGLGHRLSGAVGVPLKAGVAGLRLTGGMDKLAGWIDSPSTKTTDANATSRYFFRPKLLIQPSANLSISLLAQIHRQKADTDNIASTANPGMRQIPGLYPSRDDSDLFNAIVQYDMGAVTLTSSTGYLKRDLLYTGQFNAGAVRVTFDNDFKQWNQELRLSSNGDGPLRYTAGVWLRDYTSFINRTSAPVVPALLRTGKNPVDSSSSAVFGDLTWQASKQWELSAGGRYYKDKRTTGTTVPLQADISADFNAFSPRVSARYEWDRNSSTYATVSKGFRSGGFNLNGSTFKPETMWNYELGHKAILMGGSVFVDGSVYYVDYTNRQSPSAEEVAPNVLQAVTRNVGKAAGPGAEAAITARLGMGLELTGTIAWNDVKYKNSTVEVKAGEPFDLVSRVTGSLSLSQRVPLSGNMKGLWRVDYQHADPYGFHVRQLVKGVVNTVEDWRSARQDLFNLRAGVEGKDWSLTLDVKNATNRQPLQVYNPPLAVNKEGTHLPPRSIGLTFRKTFGAL